MEQIKTRFVSEWSQSKVTFLEHPSSTSPLSNSSTYLSFKCVLLLLPSQILRSVSNPHPGESHNMDFEKWRAVLRNEQVALYTIQKGAIDTFSSPRASGDRWSSCERIWVRIEYTPLLPRLTFAGSSKCPFRALCSPFSFCYSCGRGIMYLTWPFPAFASQGNPKPKVVSGFCGRAEGGV